MPTHPATLSIDDLLAQCSATTTRRSGPGGQHRNKVETAVVLTHTPSGISAEANERRSQDANRREALARLRVRLAIEIRTPAEEPSKLWKQRTARGRIVVSATHDDFAPTLAEALNHLTATDFDTATAAQQLGVSATQLVNLLRKSTAAFTKLNAERENRGLRPLK
jgi:protein subunit release factor B